jgi:acetylornithine/N-succinyldiaminopimelate aminotransferase
VAIEFMDILEGLLPHIRQMGGYFQMQLEELGKRYGFVKEVRGRGLMIGMELSIPGKQIVLDAIEQGLLINCTHDTVLRMLPPYIITEKEIDRGIRILNKVLKGAAKRAVQLERSST